MADLKGSLSELLSGAKPKAKLEEVAASEDAEEMTIAQMDGRYSAMRPANKNLTRMHVIKRNGEVETFQYHFNDVKGTFKGGEFEVIFAGTKHWKITVKGHGPKFWAIYDYISLHRWPYLREATGSMPGAAGADETVLTEIKITDVTPREE